MLEHVWERRFIRGKVSEWKTRALFRSLEMAYHATTMPFKNHWTIYDIGSNVSLWVSAFEVLSHPLKGKANLLSVLELLGRYVWDDKVMKRKIYKVTYQGVDDKVNLSQRLYQQLYDTRNKFLHGDPISPNRLYPFKNRSLGIITEFAPLIYKVALLSFLDKFKRRSKCSRRKDFISKSASEKSLSDAIMKSRPQNT